MKDNFSKRPDLYKQFRPVYPAALFRYLEEIVPTRDRAWDCGTGNGQVAAALAEIFHKVEATDISERQMSLAPRRPNIDYTVASAEHPPFADSSFSLITAGQAAHWFVFSEFFSEARRTLIPGGIISLFGYTRPRVVPVVDAILDRYYGEILAGHWDPERHFVEERYGTIPFPFTELPPRSFEAGYMWKVDECLGYLSTWSAATHYIERHGRNPVTEIESELREAWGAGEARSVVFDIFCRTGVRD